MPMLLMSKVMVNINTVNTKRYMFFQCCGLDLLALESQSIALQ
jgi:hypothetical protein